MDASERELWERFATAGQDREAIRNKLVERYYPLVKTVAYKAYCKTPESVCYDDLLSEGCIGLMQAVESFDLAAFDASRAKRPACFLMRRVCGAMSDYLRSQDVVTRLTREKLHRIEAAEQAAGRRLYDWEVQDQLGIELPQRPRTVGLDSPNRAELDFDRETRSYEPTASKADPDGLRDAGYLLRTLSKLGKLAILLYEVEGLSQKEVGAELGISESRVSQLLTDVKKSLRKELGGKYGKAERKTSTVRGDVKDDYRSVRHKRRAS